MKRILVVESDQLLVAGVESLLNGERALKVKRVVIDDEVDLTKEIKIFQPSVLIMDDRLYFAKLPVLFGLIKDYPGMRVIVVNSVENRLHVYDKREILITSINDLLATVHGGLAPSS